MERPMNQDNEIPSPPPAPDAPQASPAKPVPKLASAVRAAAEECGSRVLVGEGANAFEEIISRHIIPAAMAELRQAGQVKL
jgi:hypothetical protein